MANMQPTSTIFIIGIKEIANLVGLGLNETKRLVKNDDFPAVKYCNRWLSTREELELWAKHFINKGKTIK
jgi:hypothetical protein